MEEIPCQNMEKRIPLSIKKHIHHTYKHIICTIFQFGCFEINTPKKFVLHKVSILFHWCSRA